MTLRSTVLIAACLMPIVPLDAHAEYVVDIGVSAGQTESRVNGGPTTDSGTDGSVYLGLGVRRQINDKSTIGVGFTLDTFDSATFLAIRAIDYRHQIRQRYYAHFFAGAARLNLATPAYGWYLGAGIEIGEVADDWNIGIDLRFGDKVARDNLLPTEASDRSPDNFHDVTAISVYLSRRF